MKSVISDSTRNIPSHNNTIRAWVINVMAEKEKLGMAHPTDSPVPIPWSHAPKCDGNLWQTQN